MNYSSRVALRIHPATPLKQRGTALFIALIVLVTMSLAAVGLVRSTDTTTLVAGNLSFNESALHAGDLGIEAATNRLQTQVAGGTAALGADATANNYYGTFDPTQPLPPSSRLCSTSGGSCTLTPNPVAANGNTAYYVIERMCNGGGNCITRDGIPLYRITVDVVGPKNTRVTTQAMVNALAAFDPDAAIITEEKLEISGNPRFTGPVKKVHTNDVLKIGGNGDPDPSVRVSEGTYTNSLEQCNLSTCNAAPYIDIPAIIPSNFLSYADYRMMADGKVYNSSGTELFDTSGGSLWNGWKRDSTAPVRWTCCNGVTPPNGMYYVEGNVNISSAPGPWSLTLLAQGHIEVSGDAFLADHKDAGDPAGVQNLFMLAGTDLKFNGNPSHTIEGIMAAGDQVSISGNPTLEGYIIAKGSSAADGLLSANNFSGNFTLNYDGDLDSPWGGGNVNRESWRVVNR